MTELLIKLKNVISRKSVLIPLAAVTLICCLVVIAGINRPHLNPFNGKLRTQYPTAAAYSDSGSVLVDKERQRLLIFNHDDKLQTVVNANVSGSPVEKFYYVTMVDDRIFAVGTTAFNHSLYLSSEKIVEYDMKGKVIKTIYTESYTEDEKICCARFAYISTGADGLYLTKVNNSEVSVLYIGKDAEPENIGSWKYPEDLYSAGYDPNGDYCFAVGLSKNCYSIACDTGEITFVSFDEYLQGLLELFNVKTEDLDLSSFAGCCCIPAIVVNEDGEAQYYCVLDSEDNIRLVLSNDSNAQRDVSYAEYSTALRITTMCYWLAVAVAALEALIALVWLLHGKKQSNNRIVLLVAGVIILISVFYINQINDSSEKSYNKALKTQAKQMSYILSEGCGDIFEEIRTKGVYEYCTDLNNQADISELRVLLKNLCDMNDSEQTCCASCYLYDKDGNLYTFADSVNGDLAGQPVYISPEMLAVLEENSQGTISEDNYAEALVYSYEYIYSGDNTIVGVLFLCGFRGNLLYVQTQNIVNMTVSLAALLIGIYMLFKLYKTFSADILRRRNRADSDVIGKSLDIVGIFSFMEGMIFNLDAALIVYVAKSLCADLSPAKVALMVSLPITMGTLGSVAGVPFSNKLRRRFNDSNIAIIASAATLVSMLILAFSVSVRNIYIYTAGIFVKCLFLGGVMLSLLQAAPHQAKSDEDKRTVLGSISSGNLSASIISALIGGYISQYLSYSAIYVVGAALCILLIFLSVITFPKNSADNVSRNNPAAKAVSGMECWKFFLHGPGLVYAVFYALPMCISNGYKSYLFPLYSAGAGISALLLSNLTVFVRTFSFITVDGVSRIARKFSLRTAMLIPRFIISACFICFLISPNIYWAIAVMFIFELLLRAGDEPIWMYLAKLAENNNLDPKQISGNNLTIGHAFNTLRAPVLSTAVSLGMNYACAAVGAVCGAMYTVFLLFGKRADKKDSASAEGSSE